MLFICHIPIIDHIDTPLGLFISISSIKHIDSFHNIIHTSISYSTICLSQYINVLALINRARTKARIHRLFLHHTNIRPRTPNAQELMIHSYEHLVL